MNYSNKIKPGLEATLTAEPMAWIGVYNVLFAALPSDLHISSIVKAIQQKLKVKANGIPGPKTWDALNQLLLYNKAMITQKNMISLDPHNEAVLNRMAEEVIPFAKELIRLAAAQNIHIRLLSRSMEGMEPTNSLHHFGLAFDIEIFEKTDVGDFIHDDDSPLYAEVAKLGESVGIFWAGNHKNPVMPWHFELRPAWSVSMTEPEMLAELQQRQIANINLLAIL